MIDPRYHLDRKKIALYLLFVLAGLTGCITSGRTGPNPVIREYPGYAILASKDKRLGDELGKLPEIQDGLSSSDKKALDRLSQYYQKHRVRFVKVFEEMMKVGLADHRRYCSPLQALYWLFEDNKLNDIEAVFGQYNIRKLLDRSWRPITSLPDKKILDLIDLIKDERLKRQYLKYVENGVTQSSKKTLHLFYTNEPYKFSSSAKQIVNSKRWDSFESVVDRISSPFLLHYYINNMGFQYREKVGPVRSPKEVFLSKRADAADMANFGHYVLSRAGYETFGRRVYHPFSDGHVGLGMETEEGGYMLVVDFRRNSKNINWGVFKSIEKLEEILGYPRKYPSKEPYLFEHE